MVLRVASDIGGTFTDLVYVVGDRVETVKCDTVYPNFEQGVIDALDRAQIDAGEIEFLAHGTTIVINALTERKGVKTGLITTRGFRDVLEIARGDTPDVFNVYYAKPKPFVPRYLRREITERLDHKGNVLVGLEVGEIDQLIADFKKENVEAIAICFLHAYANPGHEQLVATRIRELWPNVDVITSYEVCRELREYERTSTTVLSAYILPPTKDYLNRLESRLRDKGLKSSPYIMQSNGGIATASAARNNPITLVESGPVGGMLGAASYGTLVGEQNMIALDIGGTTAKCSLIHDGVTRITTEYVIEKSAVSSGYPIRTPVIDIVEIGNGGGSIAWVDEAGALHVGPKSAGSTPGPVAYGRGGDQVTTTDANLYTGRINPENFAGGEITPDVAAVTKAFSALGDVLGVDGMHAAHGVIQIANANMVNALKLVSVNRGHDPRDFALMAFGGGGALHAAELAAELNIPKVIIPPNAGVFSAWGMLMLDLRRDSIRTLVSVLDSDNAGRLESAYMELEDEASGRFSDEGFATSSVTHQRFVDARYVGQEHTVKVRLPAMFASESIGEIIESFHKEHEREFTFRLDSAIEAVNIHLVSFCAVERSTIANISGGSDDSDPLPIGGRKVDFDAHGVHETNIYNRTSLRPGMTLNGPAIIEESTTTTVVLPDNRVEVDALGGLQIHISGGDSK